MWGIEYVSAVDTQTDVFVEPVKLASSRSPPSESSLLQLGGSFDSKEYLLVKYPSFSKRSKYFKYLRRRCLCVFLV